MEWLLSVLPLLACPLMMLLCMKGMRGNQDCHNKTKDNSMQEIESLKAKVTELTEQNQRLMPALPGSTWPPPAQYPGLGKDSSACSSVLASIAPKRSPTPPSPGLSR
jgi:hypothetical protein